MFSPKRWASSLDSSRVFPCSLVRIGAISSTFPSMCRAALCRISARLAGASLDQLPNALARRGVADLVRLSGSSLGPLAFNDHRCHSYLLSRRPTCQEGERMAGVRLEKEGGVGVIVLDRPPANTYDYAFLREFAG